MVDRNIREQTIIITTKRKNSRWCLSYHNSQNGWDSNQDFDDFLNPHPTDIFLIQIIPAGFQSDPITPGVTPLYGLYGDVRLDRVWFLASRSETRFVVLCEYVLNRVYNFARVCPNYKQSIACPKQGNKIEVDVLNRVCILGILPPPPPSPQPNMLKTFWISLSWHVFV